MERACSLPKPRFSSGDWPTPGLSGETALARASHQDRHHRRAPAPRHRHRVARSPDRESSASASTVSRSTFAGIPRTTPRDVDCSRWWDAVGGCSTTSLAPTWSATAPSSPASGCADSDRCLTASPHRRHREDRPAPSLSRPAHPHHQWPLRNVRRSKKPARRWGLRTTVTQPQMRREPKPRPAASNSLASGPHRPQLR